MVKFDRLTVSLAAALFVWAGTVGGQECTDNNLCTVDACVDGSCSSESTVSCAQPSDPCMIAVCNPGTGSCSDIAIVCSACQTCQTGVGCVPVTDGTLCTDGVACTDDRCEGGACVGTPDDSNSCDDANSCTDDSCVSGACVGIPNDSNSCDLGTCVNTTACQTGFCVPVSVVACDAAGDPCGINASCAGLSDGDPCNDWVCADGPAGPTCVVETVAAGATCDDGNDCSQNDRCRVISVASFSFGVCDASEASGPGGGVSAAVLSPGPTGLLAILLGGGAILRLRRRR